MFKLGLNSQTGSLTADLKKEIAMVRDFGWKPWWKCSFTSRPVQRYVAHMLLAGFVICLFLLWIVMGNLNTLYSNDYNTELCIYSG